MTGSEIAAKVEGVISLIEDGTGYLQPEQANRFIDILVEESVLLQKARVVRMNAPKRKIEKVGFGSRVLHEGPGQATALDASKRATPDFEIIELETKEIIGEYWIPYDVLEDNIERADFEDTLMRHFTTRAATDLEELFISGDTESSDAYLAVTDGLLQLVKATHYIDGSGITEIDKTLFKMGLQYMPTKYLRYKNLMEFYCSHHVDLELRDSLANRMTVVGDNKTIGFAPNMVYGVPVVPAALMPDDKLVLTYPNNMIFGIQRQIMIETDRFIRERVIVVVLTMRIDIALERPDAAVIVEDFSDPGLPTFSTTTTTTTTTSS